jgi:hypothetical protein
MLLMVAALCECASSNGGRDGGGSDSSLPIEAAAVSCGPMVSGEDCRLCGSPPDSVCASGQSPPAPACTDPTPGSESCCFAGLGRYCSCDRSFNRWRVVVCDPPVGSQDAGPGS